IPARECLHRALERHFRRLAVTLSQQSDFGSGMLLEWGRGHCGMAIVMQFAKEQAVRGRACEDRHPAACAHSDEAAQPEVAQPNIAAPNQRPERIDGAWA